jgi:F0F1-type ATP synthase membrane subunit b/b'
MTAAMKDVFMQNPALAWVFFLGLLGLVGILGKALYEVFLSLVQTRQDAIHQNIARTDTAIQKLETATTRAIDDLSDAQKTVTQSFNGAVDKLQVAIGDISKMMNATASMLHEKINTTNEKLADHEKDEGKKLAALEVEVKAHRRECDLNGRLCPHRSHPLADVHERQMYQGD